MSYAARAKTHYCPLGYGHVQARQRMPFLAHQTEIATLFAWVIKLHLTQVFSPRLKKIRKTFETNQILGVVVQKKRI